MFARLFKRKSNPIFKDEPFEPVRTSKKEGILNVEEVEDRIGGGAVTGYYHFVRTERAEGELLEVIEHTKSYHRHITSRGIFDLYDPTEHAEGLKLKIRDDKGTEGEVYFPEKFSKMDEKIMLSQRIKYEHKSDRMCERCPSGDTKFHEYFLTILTGQLEGEKFFQKKYEHM